MSSTQLTPSEIALQDALTQAGKKLASAEARISELEAEVAHYRSFYELRMAVISSGNDVESRLQERIAELEATIKAALETCNPLRMAYILRKGAD